MENTIMNQIQDRHQLETHLLRLQQQHAENGNALRQAKFDLRTAQEEQALYSGSFRSFRDKLAGKREEAETALRHAVQKAEADLASAQQTEKRLGLQLAEIQSRLEALPGWNALKEQADSESLKEWHRLEAAYCVEVLLPLLEENHTALIEQRKMLSGANAGKVYTYSEQAETYTAPEKAGQNCKPYILRLRTVLAELNIPFVPCSYFDDPVAFVNAVIAKHNRRDKLNEAITQVESLQGMLPELQKQLEV